MPKGKKSKDSFANEFPALTRLIQEIERYREKERIQPRLPFLATSDALPGLSQSSLPGESVRIKRNIRRPSKAE